jgi:cysteine synthase
MLHAFIDLRLSTESTSVVRMGNRKPANSVKERIGAKLIYPGEQDGLLPTKVEIVESTGANTGITITIVAAARGHLTISV